MSVLFKRALCALSMLAAGVASAAPTLSVSPGNWVVTSEVNGQPGRGMGIEVHNGTLLMTVYNYKASGEATFHLTAGTMAGNSFTGQLLAFKGGRSLGSEARDAVADGSAGVVNIQFTGANTGTIQFPGEAPVTMSHFMFDGIAAGKFMPAGMAEYWLATELDGAGQPLSTSLIGVGLNASGELLTTSGTDACTVDSTNAMARCKLVWNAQKKVTADIEMQRVGPRWEGLIRTSASPGTTRRLVAVRSVSEFASPHDLVSDMATTVENSEVFFRPEAGMWVLTAENNGKAGRGLTIESQTNTLVLQLYGYQADGKATFHIGAARIQRGESSVPLNKARGGRYYGGGALTGADAGSDGMAQIRFTSTTKGQIRLPGEQWADIEKFQFGVAAPDPQSLLGAWSVLLNAGTTTPTYTKWDLTQLQGTRAATTSGSFGCIFATTPHGTVRCTETFSIAGRGTVLAAEYRFTPAFGSGPSLGHSMKITSAGVVDAAATPERIVLQRVTDSTGATAGLKSAADELDGEDEALK